LPVQICRTA